MKNESKLVESGLDGIFELAAGLASLVSGHYIILEKEESFEIWYGDQLKEDEVKGDPSSWVFVHMEDPSEMSSFVAVRKIKRELKKK
jgi:hypothetical protein